MESKKENVKPAAINVGSNASQLSGANVSLAQRPSRRNRRDMRSQKPCSVAGTSEKRCSVPPGSGPDARQRKHTRKRAKSPRLGVSEHHPQPAKGLKVGAPPPGRHFRRLEWDRLGAVLHRRTCSHEREIMPTEQISSQSTNLLL